ncbi:MAG: hypothetical protein KC619_18640 [Myxococcales bacterium]|nr:hypothetical protein [Myxococcales bacterium]
MTQAPRVPIAHRDAAARLAATQSDLFWIPDDVRVLRREGLLALSCPRPVSHLNIGLRADLPEPALERAVAEARATFAPRSGRWFVPDLFDTRPLERALAAQRFVEGHTYEARVRSPEAFVARPRADAVVRRVEDLAGFRDFVSVTAAAFGVPARYSDEELLAELPRATGPEARSRRWVVYDGGRPVCSGGLNLYPDLSIGFLWAGGTVPDARGRGFYSAIVAARMAELRGLGLELAGVYARVETSAPIVAAQGFEKVGAMTYWADVDAALPP